MKLLALFKPKRKAARIPGRHTAEWSTHRIAELEAQLAPLAGVHPVCCIEGHRWWTVGDAGDCPWCQAEDLADELVPYRTAQANAHPLNVPAQCDGEDWGQDAASNAETRRDSSLADWAEHGEARLLTALVDGPTTRAQPAVDLEPARIPSPPPWPPARLVDQVRTTWTGPPVRTLAEVFGATADLKQQVTPSDRPRPSVPVRLVKAVH